jgi:hypothetical protein
MEQAFLCSFSYFLPLAPTYAGAGWRTRSLLKPAPCYVNQGQAHAQFIPIFLFLC